MKLNNKGFTLIEVLAVVVILSVLMAIMVPSVNHLIEQNKVNNYDSFERGILNATKILLSDYRYDIVIDGSCSSSDDKKDILKIGNYDLVDSQLPIQVLVDENNISTDAEGKIHNPMDKSQTLNLSSSYVFVQYQCKNKDFSYLLKNKLNEYTLIWE